MPKTKEKCDEKINVLKKGIEKTQAQKSEKQANSDVALGTSKINYMDPRITIAWAKKKEVPIEKLFPKTLRDKFAWAMSCNSNWEF